MSKEQTWLLKNLKMYSPTGLEARSLDTQCQLSLKA